MNPSSYQCVCGVSFFSHIFCRSILAGFHVLVLLLSVHVFSVASGLFLLSNAYCAQDLCAVSLLCKAHSSHKERLFFCSSTVLKTFPVHNSAAAASFLLCFVDQSLFHPLTGPCCLILKSCVFLGCTWELFPSFSDLCDLSSLVFRMDVLLWSHCQV